jgi:hypothetical protein
MSPDDRIFRVQDREGRGPWRPGFSVEWVNPDRTCLPPSVFVDIPQAASLVRKWGGRGFHVGCAVRAGKFSAWFDGGEIERLRARGYRLVNAAVCRVIAESDHQLLVVHAAPLRRLPQLLWDSVAGVPA